MILCYENIKFNIAKKLEVYIKHFCWIPKYDGYLEEKAPVQLT